MRSSSGIVNQANILDQTFVQATPAPVSRQRRIDPPGQVWSAGLRVAEGKFWAAS